MHSSSDAITQEVKGFNYKLILKKLAILSALFEYPLIIYGLICVIPPQFMDLRTRYTALVTFTTQHVKYISDALRRLEEEEVGL